jgi:hypothetical protein
MPSESALQVISLLLSESALQAISSCGNNATREEEIVRPRHWHHLSVLSKYDQPSGKVDLIPRKGHLVRFFKEHKKSYALTTRWIERVFGVFISKDDVKSVMKKFDMCSKSVYKGDQAAQLNQLELFCDVPLRGRHAASTPRAATLTTKSSVSSIPDPTPNVGEQQCSSSSNHNQQCSSSSLHEQYLSDLNSPSPSEQWCPTVQSTRSARKYTEREERLRKQVLFLSKEIDKKSKLHRTKMQETKALVKHYPLAVKNLRRQVRRQRDTISNLKSKLMSVKCQLRKKTTETARLLAKQKLERKIEDSYQQKMLDLQNIIKEQNDQIHSLQNEYLLPQETEEDKQYQSEGDKTLSET